VADEVPNKVRPFDVGTVKALVQLMARNDLNEIDLREGELRIRLLRGMQSAAPPVGYVAPPMAMPIPSPGPTTAPKDAATSAPAGPARKLLEIKSPGVGTFYVAREPGAAPFVRIGDRVTPTTIVGILEAMKVMNEIQADCSGVIVEALVDNEKPIEFDTVLYRVDPGA
jgi:acetyl-CoA carboxylase biotin carboxyl carrier protein